MRLLLKAVVIIGMWALFAYFGSPPDMDTLLGVLVIFFLCNRLVDLFAWRDRRHAARVPWRAQRAQREIIVKLRGRNHG